MLRKTRGAPQRSRFPGSHHFHIGWNDPGMGAMNLLLVGDISQLGWLFPIYGKINHVPNHQPDLVCWLPLPNHRATYMNHQWMGWGQGCLECLTCWFTVAQRVRPPSDQCTNPNSPTSPTYDRDRNSQIEDRVARWWMSWYMNAMINNMNDSSLAPKWFDYKHAIIFFKMRYSTTKKQG